MLIKSAEDRTKDLEALKTLLKHPDASDESKKKVEKELQFLNAGTKGERDAAYELDFHWRQSQNFAILHDIRLEYKDRVAQIDHLIINRYLDIWVLESKSFSEGIAINEHGECAAFYKGRPYGVPSPFAQNKKHCVVLEQIIRDEGVQVPKRLGIKINPTFTSLILVSRGARITRPKLKKPEYNNILKVDQIKEWAEKFMDRKTPGDMLRLVSSDTLRDFAVGIRKLHKAGSFDWNAKFGIPETNVATAPPEPKIQLSEADGSEGKSTEKTACVSCGTKVPLNVARFCWFNKARFGGHVYCRECQGR